TTHCRNHRIQHLPNFGINYCLVDGVVGTVTGEACGTNAKCLSAGTRSVRCAYPASSTCCASSVRSAERRLVSFAGPRLAGKFYQRGECTVPKNPQQGYRGDTAAIAEAAERGGGKRRGRAATIFATELRETARYKTAQKEVPSCRLLNKTGLFETIRNP